MELAYLKLKIYKRTAYVLEAKKTLEKRKIQDAESERVKMMCFFMSIG
jgi:hypothetical protein